MDEMDDLERADEEADLWDLLPPLRRYAGGFRVRGRCLRCGCTETHACRETRRRGCAWVDPHATLCSRCDDHPGRRRWRWRRRTRLAAPWYRWAGRWRAPDAWQQRKGRRAARDWLVLETLLEELPESAPVARIPPQPINAPVPDPAIDEALIALGRGAGGDARRS